MEDDLTDYAHLPYDKRRRLADAPMTPADIEELQYRLGMTMFGMPRICALRRCRRQKRCFGPVIPCSHHHRALIEARAERAIVAMRSGRTKPPSSG